MAKKLYSQGFGLWEIKSANGNTIIVNDHDFSEDEIGMLEEIYLGTDRTLIVVSVAYLENYLRRILRTFLIDDDVAERLLDPMGGALSGFASMADMIFACGLMRKEEHKILKTLARIRNRFAHDASIQTFTHLEEKAQSEKSLPNDIQFVMEYSKREFEAMKLPEDDDWMVNVDPNLPASTMPNFQKLRDSLEFAFEHLVNALGHEIIITAVEKRCERLAQVDTGGTSTE